jgi:hypothetical protein
MAAYIDAVCTANFEIMEEASRMSDTTTVYGKTLETAGYVTRKMILAKMEGETAGKIAGKEEKALEIARKMKAGKVPASQISAYTGLAEQQIADLQFSGWNRDFKVMEEAEKTKAEIARKMKAGKVPASQISAYTGLAEQQIADL